MNTIKGYFQPASKKPYAKDSKKGLKHAAPVAPPMMLGGTPPVNSPTSTPGRTPFTSRPSSIFPDGDFRNTTPEGVADIKADVMVSWLHQQQVEKLWSTSLAGEGVMLKKARDSYSCCPPSMRNDESGIFDHIAAMNVRVRLQDRFYGTILTFYLTVRHDCEHSRYQAVLDSTYCGLCPTLPRSPITSPPLCRIPTSMPKASFRCIYKGPAESHCLG
jgi:hypothetical protein